MSGVAAVASPGACGLSHELYRECGMKNAAPDAMFLQWQRFMAGQEVDRQIVKPMVYESWLRSRAYGVRPDRPSEVRVDDARLAELLAANSEFVESSKVIMEKLFTAVENANSVISLTDNQGVVLLTHVHNNQGYRLPSHMPGYVFSERACGTNGIGTCLHCAAPVELVGAEHYCLHDHIWYCSAAPIFDSKSRLLGVFNISIASESFHHHTRGMVEAAAHAITEQVCLRELLSEQAAIMELLDEGVIVVDHEGVLKSVSQKACAILGIASPPGAVHISRIIPAADVLHTALTRQVSFHDHEVLLELPQGAVSCLISATPTPQKGVVFTLREGKRMRELATRALGAKASYTFDRIIGDSEPLREAIRQGRLAAQSDITTLIIGESGTGKELFAQSIHNASHRASQPFVVVNCGALPRNLIQSELFGYDEGAFIGASRQGKPGKFELADGGTIFLDEIGEMPLEAQVSLLRLLQNREVTRIGGKSARRINIRVIAATNRDLEEAVRQNVFRHDLYYRLNAFLLNIPPLAARRGDVELLAGHFLRKFAAALGKHVQGISPEARELLYRYPWPGNVRELENAIERAVNVCSGQSLTPEDFPAAILQHRAVSGVSRKGGRLWEQETETIQKAILETGGNLRQAAQLLGISRSTLYLKMKKGNLRREDLLQ